LGLLIGLSVAPIHRVLGQGGGPPAISAHHDEQNFSIAPGGSASFAIPNTQEPVFIAVSETVLNGGTQLPSEIMSAVVNQDPSSFKFTWVGTNSDATMQAGTSTPSGSNPLIAKICGGVGCLVTNFTLEVNSDTTLPGTLKLTSSANTVGLTAHFKVNLWY